MSARIDRAARPTRLLSADRWRLKRDKRIEIARARRREKAAIRAGWAIVWLMLIYAAPHIVEHVRTSPAFQF